MTYKDTLNWMYAQLPMYQQKGAMAFNAKLDGIIKLSHYLGNPHQKFKSIHVAGTNGKGSSSHMLASILHEAGYKTGLYTSPHLKDFRERIRINGKMVGERYVIDFVKSHRSYLESNRLSFFEMTVGMAFNYFAKEKVDIAIVETGLGGRLDSTNIITPEVSLITNIGYDHMDILGDSLSKIAYEKAGIIKYKVPVIVSEFQNETIGVFKNVAQEKSASLLIADQQEHSNYEIDLLGEYQKKNKKGVLAVLQQLKGFKVDEKHILAGLKKVTLNTGLLGRWQQIGSNPKIICDTAHNAEGLSLVMKQLRHQDYAKLHMVIGVVKGKDLSRILPLFPKEAMYYFCKPEISRGFNEISLKNISEELGLIGNSYDSVDKAFIAAKKNAKKKDFIYVGGSTFVVGEVL